MCAVDSGAPPLAPPALPHLLALFLQLLRRAVDDSGRTVVMVTHDPAAASIADRVVLLSDGHVVLDREGMDADEVFDAVRGLDRT